MSGASAVASARRRRADPQPTVIPSVPAGQGQQKPVDVNTSKSSNMPSNTCLLYTSDAADE